MSDKKFYKYRVSCPQNGRVALLNCDTLPEEDALLFCRCGKAHKLKDCTVK